MKAVQEVTQWETDLKINHVYLLEGNRMLAYIPAGTKKPIYFKQPLSFDIRGRKFLELKKSPFDMPKNTEIVEVPGSAGAVYRVNPIARTCDCMGFNFRGKCRHLEQVLGKKDSK
jgi:hypothetical protein